MKRNNNKLERRKCNHWQRCGTLSSEFQLTYTRDFFLWHQQSDSLMWDKKMQRPHPSPAQLPTTSYSSTWSRTSGSSLGGGGKWCKKQGSLGSLCLNKLQCSFPDFLITHSWEVHHFPIQVALKKNQMTSLDSKNGTKSAGSQASLIEHPINDLKNSCS